MRPLVLSTWAALFGAAAWAVDVGFSQNEKVRMNIYEEKEGTGATYMATVYFDGEMDMAGLERLSQVHFNWLNDQPKHWKEVGERGTCLVSALWAPEDKTVYLSSKAKGEESGYLSFMRDMSIRERVAPIWAARTKPGGLITAANYHAEDTAYFFFEQTHADQGNPLFSPKLDEHGNSEKSGMDQNGQLPIDIKYPPGTMLATYGYIQSGYKPRHMVPCWEDQRGRKSCQKVARDLGVRFDKREPSEAQRVEEAAAQEDNIPPGDAPACPAKALDGSDYGSDVPMDDLDPNGNIPKRWAPRGLGSLGRYHRRAKVCNSTITLKPYTYPAITVTSLWEEDGKTATSGEATKRTDTATTPGETPRRTTSPTTTSHTTSIPTTTKAPNPPTCEMQDALPDEYSSAFCRCTQGGETKTLPLLTVKDPDVISESCSYTDMPTNTVATVTKETITWTQGCNVYGGPGGIQNGDPSWQTTIEGCVPPRPTYALFLGDKSVALGTSTNDDDGKDMGKKLIDGIKDHCPEKKETDDNKMGICKTDSFHIVDVPLIIDEGIEYMVLQATIEDSNYNSTKSLDYMLYSIAGGLVSAAQKNCTSMEYKDTADQTESGCGNGPFRKRNPPPPMTPWDLGMLESTLDRRVSPGDVTGPQPMTCTYKTDSCTGPRLITAVLGTQADPYMNMLSITFELVKKEEGGLSNPIAQFFCESVVEGLALAAMRYLPKLPGFEGVSQIEDLAMEALCGQPE